MARANRRLITALFVTAGRLEAGTFYKWTHMGACNCGHLAQTLTALSPAELRARALEKAGDWAEQAVEYCPASGLVIDYVLGTMLDVGLSPDDIGALERLGDPAVLRRFPPQERQLDFRRRDDVVRYLRAWAALLEAQLDEPGPGAAVAAPIPLSLVPVEAGAAPQREAG